MNKARFIYEIAKMVPPAKRRLIDFGEIAFFLWHAEVSLEQAKEYVQRVLAKM